MSTRLLAYYAAPARRREGPGRSAHAGSTTSPLPGFAQPCLTGGTFNPGPVIDDVTQFLPEAENHERYLLGEASRMFVVNSLVLSHRSD